MEQVRKRTTQRRESFGGRETLAEGIFGRESPLRTSWGMDIRLSESDMPDRRAESALHDILGVPVTVREIPKSKKANLRELEQEWIEQEWDD